MIAVCMRSGIKCHASELVRDGRIPSLMVLPEWADPAHPQERPYVPDDKEGVPSWQASPDSPPITPPVLDATAPPSLDPEVDVTWTAAVRAAGPPITEYELYRDAGAGFVLLGTYPVTYNMFGGITAQTLSYIDLAVSVGGTYGYKVVGLTEQGQGSTSNVDSATVSAAPTIVAPVLSAINNGDGTITLNWTAATGLPVTAYRLYRSPQGARTYSLIYTGPLLTFLDSVVIDDSYDYRVDALIDGVDFPSNVVSIAAAETDPYFANVVALLHMNGADGGSTFTDNSSYARTISLTGTPTTVTAIKKYGTAAMSAPASSYVSFADSPEVRIATGDFTIEFWAYRASGSTSIDFHKQAFTSVYPCRITITNSSAIGASGGNAVGAGVYSLTGLATFPSAQWVHVAVTRSGSTFRLFQDGVLQASATYAGTLGENTANWRIGEAAGSTGLTDDYRFTVGVARYTSDFTPPARQFPDS